MNGFIYLRYKSQGRIFNGYAIACFASSGSAVSAQQRSCLGFLQPVYTGCIVRSTMETTAERLHNFFEDIQAFYV